MYARARMARTSSGSRTTRRCPASLSSIHCSNRSPIAAIVRVGSRVSKLGSVVGFSRYGLTICSLLRAGCSQRLAPHSTRPCRVRLGLSRLFQQLAGGAFDLQSPIGVGNRSCMRGGGDRHVPDRLDRSALLGLVNGLDGRDHGFAKPVGEELVEIGVDALGAGIFDRLLHRFRRALRVFGEDRDGFFQPPVGGAGGVPDADLGVLVRAPNDAVAADVIEEKEPDAERRVANLAVPDDEPAGQGTRAAVAAAADLDPAFLVGEEHEHVAITRIEGRVVVVDLDAVAELARNAPVPGDTIAKALDESVGDMRVPDAPVARAGSGPQLGLGILTGDQDADVFDIAGEPQIEVEAIRNDRRRQLALPEIRRRRGRRRQGAELTKRPMRRRGNGAVGVADEEASHFRVGLIGKHFELPRAEDRGPAVLELPARERLQFEEREETLVGGPGGPLPARLHQGGHRGLSFRMSRAGGALNAPSPHRHAAGRAKAQALGGKITFMKSPPSSKPMAVRKPPKTTRAQTIRNGWRKYFLIRVFLSGLGVGSRRRLPREDRCLSLRKPAGVTHAGSSGYRLRTARSRYSGRCGSAMPCRRWQIASARLRNARSVVLFAISGFLPEGARRR